MRQSMNSKRIVPNQDLSMHIDNTHVEIDIYVHVLEVLQVPGTNSSPSFTL